MSVGCPGSWVMQLPGREGGAGPASSLLPPACANFLPSHNQCLQPPPTGTLPSEQVTLPEGQPQASQKEGDRKILGWELR